MIRWSVTRHTGDGFESWTFQVDHDSGAVLRSRSFSTCDEAYAALGNYAVQNSLRILGPSEQEGELVDAR